MAIRDLMEVVRFPWIKKSGLMSNTAGIDYSFDRTYTPAWENPTAGLPPVLGVGVDTSANLTWGGGAAVQPLWQPAVFTFAANAGLLDQPFFIANQTYRVKKIVEIHNTACAVASTTCVVRKVPAGYTIARGTALQTSTFALDGTANTQQTATLSTNLDTLRLVAGDRLAVDFSSATLTTLDGVVIVVYLQPIEGGVPTVDVTYYQNVTGTQADAQFFVANDRYTILAARCSVTAVGSSTPKVQITKDTSTNAPGAGTDLLTNNTSTGFALGTALTTANAVQTAAFATTAGLLDMATGDRLSVDYAGTLTLVAGVVITVSLIPTQAARTEVSYYFTGASVNTDQCFFIADRDYRAVIASEVHAVAAGGTSTCQITKDSGTDAPGAGTDLLLAAFDLNGTAQTVDPDLLAAAPYTTHLKAGDRLSIDFAHAVQSGTGVLVTVGLNAI